MKKKSPIKVFMNPAQKFEATVLPCSDLPEIGDKVMIQGVEFCCIEKIIRQSCEGIVVQRSP